MTAWSYFQFNHHSFFSSFLLIVAIRCTSCWFDWTAYRVSERDAHVWWWWRQRRRRQWFLFRGGIITITLIATDNINIVLFKAFIFVGFFRQRATRGILQLSTYLLLMLHATILKPMRKQFCMQTISTWKKHTMFWPWRTRITEKKKRKGNRLLPVKGMCSSLTCASDRFKALASSTRSGVLKYFCPSNRFSSPFNWWSLNTVRAFRRRQCFSEYSLFK